jgi:class 3 adenylate cyclase
MKARKQMSAPGDGTTARQQVAATVLFADICGSTRLFEEYGNWQARQIESRILELLKAEDGRVRRHGDQDHRR